MTKILRFSGIVSLFLLFNSILFCQTDYGKLDAYINKAVQDFNIPGLAVGIVKNGQIVFSKGYGLRNTETGDPVTPETIFGLASVSKAFTAACIGILVDEGKINWDDKVTDHLSWFKLHDPYVTRELTVRDLLCHRSGLATFDGDLLWYATDYSREEIVKRISLLPLKNGFREKYGYQNVMYITAGEVIKAVTGKTWDEFVQERIFTPLNMSSSNTSTSEYSSGKNWSFPHIEGKPLRFLDYDNSGPAASINSSVNDLLNWLMMWLNKGKFNDTLILSEAAISVITSPHLVLNSGQGNEIMGTHFRNYGLGWALYDYSGRKIIEHSGGLPGVHTKAAIVPEDSLGIVILSNQINFLINPLLKKILDYHLNDKDVDYAAEALQNFNKYLAETEEKRKKKEESRIKETFPSLLLKEYAGLYEDKMYGKAEVTFSGSELILTLLPTKELFTSKMEHWHYNTFRIKFADPFLPEGLVTFDFNPDGNISGFKIDLPNPDFHFYNLNFKKK
ncbi:MAG: serine hydrolase [Ignavibacteriaceae bacterium]